MGNFSRNDPLYSTSRPHISQLELSHPMGKNMSYLTQTCFALGLDDPFSKVPLDARVLGTAPCNDTLD